MTPKIRAAIAFAEKHVRSMFHTRTNAKDHPELWAYMNASALEIADGTPTEHLTYGDGRREAFEEILSLVMKIETEVTLSALPTSPVSVLVPLKHLLHTELKE